MKHFLFIAALSVSVLSLTAAEAVKEAAPAETAPTYSSWTPFQLGFFPYVPSYVNNSHVIGIKTGWPVSGGNGSRVDGFESSWAYSGTETVNGVQASIFMNFAHDIDGFQPAIALCFCTRSLIGVQASCLFNLAGDVTGMQAGALNIARSIDGFQPSVLGCIAEKVNGVQAGLFAMTKDLDGIQISLANFCRTVGGTYFQFGLVNVVSEDKGVQFGLINVIKKGKVPFIPFFNISL